MPGPKPKALDLRRASWIKIHVLRGRRPLGPVGCPGPVDPNPLSPEPKALEPDLTEGCAGPLRARHRGPEGPYARAEGSG